MDLLKSVDVLRICGLRGEYKVSDVLAHGASQIQVNVRGVLQAGEDLGICGGIANGDIKEPEGSDTWIGKLI